MKTEQEKKSAKKVLKFLGALIVGMSAALAWKTHQTAKEIESLNKQYDEILKRSEQILRQIEGVADAPHELQDTAEEPNLSHAPYGDYNGEELFTNYFGKDSLASMRIEGDAVIMDLIDGGPIAPSDHHKLTSSTMTYDFATRTSQFVIEHPGKTPRISDHAFSAFTPEYRQTMRQFACRTAAKQGTQEFQKNHCPETP